MFKIIKLGIVAVAAFLAFAGKAFAVIPASTTEALNNGLTQFQNDFLFLVLDNLGVIMVLFAVMLGVVWLLEFLQRRGRF